MAECRLRFVDGRPSGGEIQLAGPARLLVDAGIFGLAVSALLTAHANARAEIVTALLAAGALVNVALSWGRAQGLLAGEHS